MTQGDNITFKIGEEIKHGKIIKIYKQVGYENHGKEVMVISLYDSHLKFYEGEIRVMNENIQIIK